MMTKCLLAPVLAFSTIAIHAGCDRSTPATGPRQVTADPVHGEGAIRGRVTLTGNHPEPSNDPAIKYVVQVSPDHGLQNVVVYIDANTEPPATDKPAVFMDQIEYQFVPRVVAVQTGQTLTIGSSDPQIHNVRFVAKLNPTVNDVLRHAGAKKDYVFEHVEKITLKCDVHPWMTGWVAVFDHHFFAVTDDEGHFEIAGLKPGTYTLHTWHELYGTHTQEVEIKDAQTPADLVLTYDAP